MKDQKVGISGTTAPQKSGGLKRRDVLLNGTTLVVASTLSAASTGFAQAQESTPAPAAGKQPNILVTMADDVGFDRVDTGNKIALVLDGQALRSAPLAQF